MIVRTWMSLIIFAASADISLAEQRLSERQKTSCQSELVSVQNKNTLISPPFTYMRLGQFWDDQLGMHAYSDKRKRKGERAVILEISGDQPVWSTVRPEAPKDARGTGSRIRPGRTVNDDFRELSLLDVFKLGPSFIFRHAPSATDPTAGINFILSGTGEQRVSFLLKTRNFESLQVTYFSADFEVPIKTDWVFIPLSQFRSLDSDRRHIGVRDLFTQIGLRSSGPAKLKFYPTIDFEPGFNGDFRQTIEALNLSAERLRAVNLFGHQSNSASTLDLDRMRASFELHDERKMKSAVIRFFESMFDPESQAFAVDVVRQGPKAIERELNKFGWSGSAQLYGKVELRKVLLSNIRVRNIPQENGAFAVLHGKYSHHMQFLAGLRQLTPDEIKWFSYFMTDFVAAPIPEYWTVWNTLFDTRRPGTPHSNRYWRDIHPH